VVEGRGVVAKVEAEGGPETSAEVAVAAGTAEGEPVAAEPASAGA